MSGAGASATSGIHLAQLKDLQSWYDRNPATPERNARLALELVSACPGYVHFVIEELVKALSQGMQHESGSCLAIGDRSFPSRLALKAECQRLLRRYPDDAQLEASEANFMLELLQHHPRGAEKVGGCLAVAAGVHPSFRTRCFYVVRDRGREDFSYLRCVDNAPTYEVTAQLRICEALCAILQLHPAACERLAGLIEDRFPVSRGRQGSVERHRNWARSILVLCTRMPALSEYLLTVLIRKMVEIDAEIHRLEDETADIEDVTCLVEAADATGTPAQLDHMADILDAQMMVMFEFLQRRLAGAVSGVPAESKFVSCLMNIFQGTIMLTHRARCVQFLWFYLASLKPNWTEVFLTFLLNTAWLPNQGMTQRLMALAYLASFTARASFLTPKFTLSTAQYLSAFAREGLQAAEGWADSGDHPHLVLCLAAVQATCYVLCFHACTFAAEPLAAGRSALDNLLPGPEADIGPEALTPVLESPLQPITRISPQVAREFIRRVAPHRPALAAALRRQLQRDGERVGEAPLEAHFPFDPYRLRHSHIFLAGVYREWAREEDSEEEPGSPRLFPRPEAFPSAVSQRTSETGDEDLPDADFTDAADAVERGFIPSVGPSPAFRPRSAADMVDVSPLCVPMAGLESDDNFTLPQASIDVGSSIAGSAILACMLNTPAYAMSRATSQDPVVPLA